MGSTSKPVMHRSRQDAVRGLGALALSSVATLAPAGDSPWLTGNWGGTRDTLAAHGLEIEFVSSVDIMAVVDGGLRDGVETPANFDLAFTLDTAAAGWWDNGAFLVYLLGNSGGDPSLRVGDAQVTSNIEAPNTFKLYEWSYEHRFADDRVALLIGLHDLNSDFYVLEHAGLFLNSSFGVGIDISQAGPSIFPTTALAARIRWTWSEAGYFMTAVYDGIPGDPDDPIGTQLSFAEGDGVFVISEIGLADGTGSYYKVGVGGWYHTARFDDIGGTPRHANGGIYLIGERDVWRSDDGRGGGAFVQVGFADDERNQFAAYVGGGLTWTGLLPGRAADVAGVAVAHARNSDAFRRLSADTERGETTIELSYLMAPAPWLTIEPDLQYVIDPGTDPGVDNALVLGVRLQLSL
ncbi:MAG: carbohydrate porin [Gammaproteobacteria bacterium]